MNSIPCSVHPDPKTLSVIWCGRCGAWKEEGKPLVYIPVVTDEMIQHVHDGLKPLGPPITVIPACLLIAIRYMANDQKESGMTFEEFALCLATIAKPYFEEEETRHAPDNPES